MQQKNTSFAPEEQGLVDLFSRSISYLRVSITDRCNLCCLYCVTEEESNGVLTKLRHIDLLSYEEILRVVSIAVSMGINKIRLTGGEPLLRRNVMEFIRNLGQIQGINDIRLTTNGVLLKDAAQDLYAAGVRKVNMSLDTLRPERFTKITGVNCFNRVWEGLLAVLAGTFSTIKLNMVVMRHVNDDEILDFVRLSQRMPIQVRFIEFMPIGHSSRWQNNIYVSNDEIMFRISRLGPLIPQQQEHDGPARVFRLGGDTPGTLGFISPLSQHFCRSCNRLRLTSAGTLRSCLLCDQEIDLRTMLREETDDTLIRAAIVSAIQSKPEQHHLEQHALRSSAACHGLMSRIGG